MGVLGVAVCIYVVDALEGPREKSALFCAFVINVH